MLTLCDKLKEGDIDRNVHHLRYKAESVLQSAIEQLKEKTETTEMLLADLKEYQASSIPAQPGAGEETEVVKTEPLSLSVEEFSTSTDSSRSLETMVYTL